MRRIIDFLKYNRKWNIALWIGIIVFLLIAFSIISNKEKALNIQQVEISIEPREELSFLDSVKVMEIIKGKDSFNQIIGSSRRNLPIDKMEADLERYPFIERADVSIDLSGKLIIKVLQRSPVLRVINNRSQSYYVAKNGYKMPLHPMFSPRVLVANGNIPETLMDSGFVSTSLLRDLLAIANHCQQDELWHSQIEQLYVDNYMDILLIPKVGNHSIVFGSADNLEDKFSRLKTFYFKGLNNVGWDTYSVINLKYDSQVVAEKRNSIINTNINTNTLTPNQ
jgi:cell division protein FtsQ